MSKLNSLLHYAETLEKAAAYIGELEAKIEGMETELRQFTNEKQAGVKDSLQKRGFEAEEIEALIRLPKAALEKVAGTGEPAWDLGKVASNKTSSSEGDIISWALS